MRALVYTAPGHVELQEVEPPGPAASEVLVEVAACGICGSDVHGFQGQSRIRVPPCIMGHEFSGRVAEVGEQVERVVPGQRVVVQPLIGCGHCRVCASGRPNICPRRQLIGAHRPGGFAQYVAVPEASVYPIPDTLSDVDASLVEPLGNALHMVSLAGGVSGRDVAVLGCGPLGVLSCAVAKLAGARRVIATDTDRHRLQVAARLGAGVTLDASQPDVEQEIVNLTGGGAEVVLEAVGVTATRRQAVEVAAPGAAVVCLGNAEAESALPMLDVINRELRLLGSYSSLDAEFRGAIALLAAGAIATKWLSTADLEQGPEILRELSGGTKRPAKAVLLVTQP